MEDKSLSTKNGSTFLYDSIWWLIVVFNKNGLDDTSNTTWVNLRINSFSTSLSNSLVHKNLNKSQTFSSTATIRKPFLMSPARATQCPQKCSKISNIDWPKQGSRVEAVIEWRASRSGRGIIDYSQFWGCLFLPYNTVVREVMYLLSFNYSGIIDYLNYALLNLILDYPVILSK